MRVIVLDCPEAGLSQIAEILRAEGKREVITLSATVSAEFSPDAPWNLLFPRGTWHGANLAPVGGSIDLDSGILEEMVANWQAAGRPKLPIRKTHRHLDDDVPQVDRLELEKAFGFLTDLRVTDRGLEAETKWTPAGKAIVDAGEFAFWSPEWQPRHRDRRTGDVKGWWLSGTALTNDPFFNEMPPVAASVDDTDTTDQPNPEQHMNEKQLEALRALYGIAATASAEEILKAAESKTKSSIPTLTAADVQKTVDAAVAPLQAQLTASKEENEKLKTAAIERETETLIADGKRAGKVLEPMKEFIVATAKREGIEAAKKIIAAFPATVPLKSIGISGDPTDGDLSAEAAHKQLTAAADDIFQKANGRIGRSDALEQAMRSNPKLVAASSRSTPTQKEA